MPQLFKVGSYVIYFWINENLYAKLPENGIAFSYPQINVNINK